MIEPTPPAPEDRLQAREAARNHELGLALARLGRWRRAAAMLRRAARQRPDWSAARLRYGEALLRLGKTAAAVAEAEAALALDPALAEAHRLRGAGLYRRRRFAEAARDFAAWAEAAPGEPLADLALARALLQTGDRDAAEAACRRAVDRDPGLCRGHLLLARLALAAGRLGQAQAHLKRASDSRPEASTPKALLARVLLRRARPEAAQRAARAALALDPGCDMAALVIAELHVVAGEIAEAAAILRRLAGRRPYWPELRALAAPLGGLLQDPSEPAAQPPPRDVVAVSPAAGAAAPGEPDLLLPWPAIAGAAIAVPARPRPDLLDHVFLVRALILRHLRLHYRDTRFGFLLEYVRPSVVMLFHYILFTALKKPMPAKIPIELFIIGSFTIWFAAVHVLRATGHTGKDATGIPGVTGLHLAVARAVWEFFSMASFAVLCVVLLQLAGRADPIPNIWATELYFMLAVALGFGIGLILLALGRVFAATEALKKNLYWILYVTSGHYFSIAQGRHGLANIVWYNPILHLSELQRQALYPGYPTELVTYWYPTVMAAALIITGLILEKCTRHRAHD